MKTFILGDIHGHWEAAKKALVNAGAVTLNKQTGTITKQMGVEIIQIGDLINGTRDSVEDDIKCLRNISMFDYVMVGNHEYPYWHNSLASSFSGFHWSTEISEIIEKNRWRFRPCKSVGGILVSHAGLSREYEDIWKDAVSAAAHIDKIWRINPGDRLFSAVGRARGGSDRYGGILWSDWSEAKTRTFSQILGHTPGAKIRRRQSTTRKTEQICIDLNVKNGAAIAGLWVEYSYNTETKVSPVIYTLGDPVKDDTVPEHRHIWVKSDEGGHRCPCGEHRSCNYPNCGCPKSMYCSGVLETETSNQGGA